MAKRRPKPLGTYLLRLEPSQNGEHVLLTDLQNGSQLEFNSLESARVYLERLKDQKGIR